VEITLGELAARFGAEVHGDANCVVRRVASLERAQEGDISFLSNPRFRRHLTSTHASAVILDREMLADCVVNALISRDPYVTYAHVASLLHPPLAMEAGIHASAVIGEHCILADDVAIAAHATLGRGVRLARGVIIGAGCVLGDGVEIGEGGRLAPNVTVHAGVRIGQRVIIHSGAVIGGEGFGFANERGVWIKIAQIGSVIIGDDVDIGSNTTIDRGALGDTVIEDGVKLDNQVQIAHNVKIGAHTAIAGCTGVAGSTSIGERCAIGGGVGISGHLEIVDDVQVTGTTFVSQSIREKGVYSSGTPFEPVAAWRRNFVRMRQLDDMAKRLHELEQEFGRMRAQREQGQNK
jgi:UDP-3-O-[3-hydroxymyristoyl] glucosamine N-acyltransferase